MKLVDALTLMLALAGSGLASVGAVAAQAPARFGQYYSGPPCQASLVDRTFSQFQVNLGADSVLVPGRLMATT